jgi:hypothetical protein
MKQTVLDFFRHGLIASGFGPMVLAILYLILQHQAGIEMLSVRQVCLGIGSLSALAFIAGGMNVIYRIEQLPLMAAILIHGGVLYISYLATYLINDWLEWGTTPILVFSGIFLLAYLVIWAVIYSTVIRKTKRLNELLKKNRQHTQPSA